MLIESVFSISRGRLSSAGIAPKKRAASGMTQLDPDRRELRLEYLITNRGRVVSKDDIPRAFRHCAQRWPNVVALTGLTFRRKSIC
jgi:hypothetical protein